MGVAIQTLLIGLVVFVGLLALAASPFVKYFSQGLTFRQSLSISIQAFAAAGAVIAAYFVSKPMLDLGPAGESLAFLVSFCLAGVVITRLGAKRGVKKTGRLGLGAKTVLSLIAASWLLAGICLLALVVWRA